MLSRRRFAAGAAAAALPASGAPADARRMPEADLTLILMGDLHSGYRWSARLLHAVSDAVAAARGLVCIVVNGDVFERNNSIARRSGGAVDQALLRGFARLAPTLVTIGNHDSDLADPASFVAQVGRSGAVLLSDIVDPRSGAPYGVPAHSLAVRGRTVTLAALGTPDMALYPPQWRGCYRVPDPARYAAERLPALLRDSALPVALVHAGLMADRLVLPLLPEGALLHGAHDHLRFSQMVGSRLHLHSGAWSGAFQIVSVRFTSGRPEFAVRDVVLDEHAPADPALLSLIAGERTRLSDGSDREVVGRLPAALTLEDAVGRTALRMRQDADVDLGLLSHTTFGDGLPGGPVTGFDKLAFLRFDGGVAVGEIPPDRLPLLLSRVNQFDGRTAYARRTGDYLHAGTLSGLPTGRPLKVAVNAYAVSSQANRLALFGWDVPGFVIAPDGLTLSHLVDRMIRAQS